MVQTHRRQQRASCESKAPNSSHHARELPRPSSRRYDRRTELARVLPVWPHELEDETPEGRWRIIGKLRRALRGERRRGIGGHWTYDLARHVELLRLYRLELVAYGARNVKRSL